MTRDEFRDALLKCRNGPGGSATWFEIIDAYDAAVDAIESKGRPPSVDAAKVAQLKAEGWGPSQIARKLGIGRASVYRALES
jgi:DNA invertase Pin-like site-specific DNA recombinase